MREQWHAMHRIAGTEKNLTYRESGTKIPLVACFQWPTEPNHLRPGSPAQEPALQCPACKQPCVYDARYCSGCGHELLLPPSTQWDSPRDDAPVDAPDESVTAMREAVDRSLWSGLYYLSIAVALIGAAMLIWAKMKGGH
jgi:hypothetical protein